MYAHASAVYTGRPFISFAGQTQLAAMWDDILMNQLPSVLHYRVTTSPADLAVAAKMVALLLSRSAAPISFTPTWMLVLTWRSVVDYSLREPVREYLMTLVVFFVCVCVCVCVSVCLSVCLCT